MTVEVRLKREVAGLLPGRIAQRLQDVARWRIDPRTGETVSDPVTEATYDQICSILDGYARPTRSRLGVYTSAATSISQVPALHKSVPWKKGTVNLDLGGGKFDLATDYLDERGVLNLVHDRYNRSAKHNSLVERQAKARGGADTATLANVLNVIKDRVTRLAVVKQAAALVRSGGTIYVSVYEADRSGPGPSGSDQWQQRWPLSRYVPEVEEALPTATVERKGKMLVVRLP
jgi:hypothetical protein